jgi:hypothetical protein
MKQLRLIDTSYNTDENEKRKKKVCFLNAHELKLLSLPSFITIRFTNFDRKTKSFQHGTISFCFIDKKKFSKINMIIKNNNEYVVCLFFLFDIKFICMYILRTPYFPARIINQLSSLFI